MVRSPMPDDVGFMNRLAEERVFVLPGGMFEIPGWFRISLTANDDMTERSLAGFAKAIEEAKVSKHK
jgi:aspartate aminotransferase